MELKLNRKQMDIGTSAFLWMRAAMPVPTGGADLAECLHIAERIQEGNDASWVEEWMKAALALRQRATALLSTGRIATGRNAMLRSASYFRTALLRAPAFDPVADTLIKESRETFEAAIAHFELPIEIVRIPYGNHALPGYYISAGVPNAPTLIASNGGDSTNEELFHTLGFVARERGFNCIVFEGPGQFSARELNPELHLRPDWEVPTGAVIDWLLQRPEVDPARIALFGWSLSSTLAMRAAAFDERIAAVISNGLVVDVYEAWFGIWPRWLQRASHRNFDRVFHLFERLSSQVRASTSLFYKLLGVDTPSAMMQAWKPFNVKGLADRVKCPVLVITGEAEYAEQQLGPLIRSIGQFLRDLKAPAWFHEFTYEEDGWAASHCQIGAQRALQEVVFDWLDMILVHPERMSCPPERWHDFKTVLSYFGKMPVVREALAEVRIRAF